MPKSLVWCGDKNIIIFSLLKNNTNNYTVHANALDDGGRCRPIWPKHYDNLKKLPFFPQSTDWRNDPQHGYPITTYLVESFLIFFHLQSHLVHYTYNCMNHPTIIIFTKFSTGFTTSYRHITKREREINTINIWSCAILPRNCWEVH